MKSVVLIDDDPAFIESLSILVKSCNELNLIAGTHSGSEGMLAIEHYRPDLIVLDIIMPNNDGLAVLKYIHERSESYNPFIYVITAMNTPLIKAILKDYNVDFIDYKPIKDEVEVKRKFGNIAIAEPKTIAHHIPLILKNPVDVIAGVVDEFEIPSHLIGSEYIKTLLIFMVDDPTLKRNLYARVATVYNCNDRGVAANINNAIKACMGSKMYRAEFGNTKAEAVLFLNHLASIAKKRLRGSGTFDSSFIKAHG